MVDGGTSVSTHVTSSKITALEWLFLTHRSACAQLAEADCRRARWLSVRSGSFADGSPRLRPSAPLCAPVLVEALCATLRLWIYSKTGVYHS